MAKKTNKRCPLQAECKRSCDYEGHELDCDYYAVNGIGSSTIEDQEQIREERARKRQAEIDEQFYLDNTDRDYIPGEIVRLPIERLHPHPDNPRKDLGDLTEIAASIQAKGILQNLTVVMQEGVDGRKLEEHDYTIILGYRRRAGAEVAGLTHVPCVIVEMTPKEQLETMAVENLQRKELTPYEQAECFQLMLDMGSSVEKITKDTGFSEATVRRRVKLLELDKEKFNKAEERGGTLQDYMRLNEIRDPEKRNKVLDKIGTSDFSYYLTDALADQQFKDDLAEVVKTLRESDWCKERTDEKYGWNTPYSENYASFGKYHKKKIKTPKDTDEASYIFIVYDTSVEVYRKGPKKKEKKDPKQVRKDRLEKEIEKVKEKMQYITDTQRTVRVEFIKNFTAFDSNQMEIEAIAAKAIVSNQCGYADVALICQIADVPTKKKNYCTIPDPERWNKNLFNQPLRALLCATYAMFEYSITRYYTTTWDSKLGMSLPKHGECEKLDLAYEGLRSLGYEMSEEEIQMQNGTHPVFQEVKDLIAAYNKETKKDVADKKKGSKKTSKKK